LKIRGTRKEMAAPRAPVNSTPKANEPRKSSSPGLLESIVSGAGSVVVVIVLIVVANIVVVVVSMEVVIVVLCVGKEGVILKLLIVALPAFLPEHTSPPHGGESNHAMVFAALPQ